MMQQALVGNEEGEGVVDKERFGVDDPPGSAIADAGKIPRAVPPFSVARIGWVGSVTPS